MMLLMLAPTQCPGWVAAVMTLKEPTKGCQYFDNNRRVTQVGAPCQVFITTVRGVSSTLLPCRVPVNLDMGIVNKPV